MTNTVKKAQGTDNHDKLAGVPTVGLKELRILDQIGTGSFSSVYLVKLKKSFMNHDWADNEVKERHFVLKRSLEGINAALREDVKICFEREATILSALPAHENIISLRYVSTNFLQNAFYGYLVLEHLDEILIDSLRKWKAKIQQEKKSLTRFHVGHPRLFTGERHHMERTCGVGLGLAKAFEFLHQHQVIYRDLKPENVGFDSDGKVRLFDFGLSRFVNSDTAQRQLTQLVGTPKYMAPEILSEKGAYDLSSDVYSYAILLWEVATLCDPFERLHTVDSMRNHVLKRNVRPYLRCVACPNMRKLLKACWDRNPDSRPSFANIVPQMKMISVQSD